MKKDIKRIVLIILGIIVGISTTVTAATLFNSKDIKYTSDKTSKTNVKDSLDELYRLANGSGGSCEEISGGCDQVAQPNLGTNQLLIPVIIEDNGKVIKTSEADSNWYNYCEKKWANAVILNSKEDIQDGTEIPVSKINSYFVWIPKYKYKLWNVESTTKSASTVEGRHSIDIIFDTTDTIDEEGKSCKTPLTSGATLNCSNGEYMTHPSFITMGVDGFWAGKFEVSNGSAVQIDSKNTNIKVVPGVASWRNINVKTMFDNSLNYSTTLNSHMMKNTEWGAVAILSHSKYGIDNEININNNSSYLTGYSAYLYTQQGTYPGETGNGGSSNAAYNTKIGYLASTTGNISGIYDMSGGAWEYTASYIQNNYGSSGFNASNISSYDSKYFDVYNVSSAVQTYQYRILGDATGEMGPFIDYKDGDGNVRHHNTWYGDSSYFVESTYPWFLRGGIAAMAFLQVSSTSIGTRAQPTATMVSASCSQTKL